MRYVYCATCQRLVSAVDVPTADDIKQMLKDASKQKTDAKTAILLAGAQTLLPMLPPETYDLLASAMPQYCPACIVEYKIGQPPQVNGHGLTQEEDGNRDPGAARRTGSTDAAER